MRKLLLMALIVLIANNCFAENKETIKYCENTFNLENQIQQAFDQNGKLNQEFQTDVNIVNSWTKNVPQALKNIFGNEKINIYLTMNSGKQHLIGVITKNAKIVDIKYDGIENPSLNVYVTEKTVKKIYCNENKITAFQNAVLNKEISYEGVQVKTKITTTVVDVVLKVLNFFKIFTGWLLMQHI